MSDMQHLSSLSLPSVCTVRSAEAADCDTIAHLARQLGYPSSGLQIRARLAEMQNSDQYAVYVAQLPGGAIAGWIGISIFRAVGVDRCAEITGLVVDEQVRSRSIGKVLLKAAEKWAFSHGCCVVTVRSNITRERAHRFYTKNAYDHSKTQHLFRKVL